MAQKSLAELYDEVINIDSQKIYVSPSKKKTKTIKPKKAENINFIKAKDEFDKKIGIKRSIEKKYLLKVKPIWNFIPVFIAIPVGFFLGFILYLAFVYL